MKFTKSLMQTAKIEVELSLDNLVDIILQATAAEMRRLQLPGEDWQIKSKYVEFTEAEEDDSLTTTGAVVTYTLEYTGKKP